MSYVRVSILGATAGGEKWSINPVFDPTLEFPGSVDQAQLDAAAAAIAALAVPAPLLTLMSSAMFVVGARVEVRDDVGDELLALSIANRATALPGTGSPKLPPQSAAVLSLRTNTPGASGRGRLYWPAMGPALTPSGRMVTADVVDRVAAFKEYLLAMRSALATAFPTIGFDLAIRSRTQQASPHVVRIQMGDVVDTQRRRRDALAETYTQSTFP